MLLNSEIIKSRIITIFNRGLAKANLSDLRDAILDFNEAIRLAPNFSRFAFLTWIC